MTNICGHNVTGPMTTADYRQAENVLTQVEHRPDAATMPSLQPLIDSTRATLADMKDSA